MTDRPAGKLTVTCESFQPLVRNTFRGFKRAIGQADNCRTISFELTTPLNLSSRSGRRA